VKANAPAPPPGDFNQNYVVDAADYVVWLKTDGTPVAFNIWRAHFGEIAGAGALSASIPEPSSLILILVVLLVAIDSRRGR
jgi:hypothetical protein